MRKYLLFFVALGLLAACNTEDNPDGEGIGLFGGKKEKSLKVKAITQEASELEFSSARLNGSCTVTNAKSDSCSVCFYFGTESAEPAELREKGTLIEAESIPSTGGDFFAYVTDLEPVTPYFYVSCVTVDEKEFLGTVMSFTTPEKPVDPVITGDVGEVTEASALVHGVVNKVPDNGLFTWGVIVSTLEVPNLENGQTFVSKELDGYNNFQVKLTGLASGTLYYYRAYVYLNEEEYYYGEVGNFQTKEIVAEVTTREPSGIGLHKLTLNGSLCVDSETDLETEVWFVFGRGFTDVEDLKANGTVMPAQLTEDGTFSVDVTSLDYNVQYQCAAFAKVYDLELCGEMISFYTDDIRATVTTDDVARVGLFSAALSGSVKVDNDSLKVENQESLSRRVWFVYGTDGTLEELKENGSVVASFADADGCFTYNLSGLQCDSTYYYVAAAKIGDKEFYGSEVKSFHTGRVSISTLDATDTGMFSSRLNGYVAIEHDSLKVQLDEALSKEVWFRYGTDSAAVLADGLKAMAVPDADGHFSCVLSDLADGTKYFFAACAQVDTLNVRGEVLSFVTDAVDAVVTTGEASDVTFDSATVSGTLTVANQEDIGRSVWFLYSLEEDTLEGLMANESKVAAYLEADGTFKARLTGLPSGVTVYYAACARVYDKEVLYGDVASFETEPVIAFISTQEAIGVTYSRATLSGLLTIASNVILSRNAWFVYGTQASEDALIAGGNKVSASVFADGSFSCRLSSLESNTTYYYMACAKVHNLDIQGEVRSFTTADLPEGAVDMDLSVAWASCNLGAAAPEEYGGYYAKEAAEDAAAAIGAGWRVPTDAELTELRTRCKWTWSCVSGVYGYEVKSKTNGNSIFLPAAGYSTASGLEYAGSCGMYWSSTLCDDPAKAWQINFLQDDVDRGSSSLNLGLSVRPVTD